jgi:hypothetical protein
MQPHRNVHGGSSSDLIICISVITETSCTHLDTKTQNITAPSVIRLHALTNNYVTIILSLHLLRIGSVFQTDSVWEQSARENIGPNRERTVRSKRKLRNKMLRNFCSSKYCKNKISEDEEGWTFIMERQIKAHAKSIRETRRKKKH